MQGKDEGLYLYTRHSHDCRYFGNGIDRDEGRRCNCVRWMAGSAPDGTRFRTTTGTTSWEKARKFLARTLAEHDPLHSVLLGSVAQESQPKTGPKSIADAVDEFLATKRGESIVDMAHYEGLFERELLPWCKERGIFEVPELDLVQVTRFRNSLKNKASVKNRKLSRLRSFFEFCRDRRWTSENPAKKLKPATEDDPEVDYFHPAEMRKVLDACYVSHHWERGRDFEHRSHRLRSLLLFMRWTGLSIIDCVRFDRSRLQRGRNGVWNVLLHRQKNGNPVFVAIPTEVSEAVTKIPPLSRSYFFWSGNGDANTAVRGWRRSLSLVFKAANLKRHGKPIRCHPHMLRHTFAIEKLLAGAALEDVSLLLGHHSIKVTEKHYLKFDQRRQDRLTKASMVDWDQIDEKRATAAKA